MCRPLKYHNLCGNSVVKMISKDAKGRYKTKIRKYEKALFYAEMTQDKTARTKVCQVKMLDKGNSIVYDSTGG